MSESNYPDECYSRDAVICPYCKHRNNPSDSDGYLYDESTDSYECESCDKEFVVNVYCSWSWITHGLTEPPK